MVKVKKFVIIYALVFNNNKIKKQGKCASTIKM